MSGTPLDSSLISKMVKAGEYEKIEVISNKLNQEHYIPVPDAISLDTGSLSHSEGSEELVTTDDVHPEAELIQEAFIEKNLAYKLVSIDTYD